MRLWTLLVLGIAVAGCGGGSLTTEADMAAKKDMTVVPPDMTAVPDLTVPPDLTVVNNNDFGGVMCGNMTCGKGESCCLTQDDAGIMGMCAVSCGDGGIPIQCDGPEDCDPNGNKYCCADVDIGAGNPPNCPINSAQSACTPMCKTAIALMCPAKNKVRLCHKGADCADDPSNKNCCDVRMGNQGVTGCVSDLIKGFLIQGGAMCF